MPEIGSAESSAGITVTTWIKGTKVLFIASCFNYHLPTGSEDRSLTGIPGRHYTIEHIYSIHNINKQIEWGSDTHKIARFVFWQDFIKKSGDPVHMFFLFSNSQATNSITGKIHID